MLNMAMNVVLELAGVAALLQEAARSRSKQRRNVISDVFVAQS